MKMFTNETIFMNKLTRGDFKIAYDPIAKRYVNIERIEAKPNGIINVYASRLTSPAIDRYNMYELTRYA